jgi:hypothetical protein
MTDPQPQAEEKRYYFIDESGDLTFFNKKKQNIIGREGVSNTFMLGVALVDDPEALNANLNALRQEILADPYFAGCPSIDPAQGKTASFFHAKDDLSEVRYRVFKLLQTIPCKVFVGIRRKQELLARQQRPAFMQPAPKITDNAVYDGLVQRVFRNLLHQSENQIVFAKRGTSDRQEALECAIAKGKANFEFKWQKGIDRPTTIITSTPSQHGGLQLIDYYLWALYRLLERGEDRFFNILSANYRTIMDIDDTREKPYGVYYTEKNPLTLQKVKPITSIGSNK